MSVYQWARQRSKGSVGTSRWPVLKASGKVC